MDTNLKDLDVTELLKLYSEIPKILKEKGIIRTKNLVGDLGEYFAIKHYNDTSGFPNLQAAPPGTRNVDALSRKGERYSIKATRSNMTGVFYGVNDPDSKDTEKQKFEYLIIVQLDEEYAVKKILELKWDTFIKHKRWNKRVRAWNLSINKQLLEDSKIIYEKG